MIGLHLIIDGILNHSVEKDAINSILTGLPEVIGMNILAGPFVVEGIPENPGWTGFVIIDKSHISIHTFSNQKSISIDVFSCQSFNEVAVLNYMKKHLSFVKMNTRIIERTE
jgi:S-adenosylmethionine/arginine decarboxylase-like enzyme